MDPEFGGLRFGSEGLEKRGEVMTTFEQCLVGTSDYELGLASQCIVDLHVVISCILCSCIYYIFLHPYENQHER